ncbi:MAG: ABC-2 transporter permease [Candidatus Aminicenantes bacterium]|nr:ABC-2 transporter permease [Candidatus Aminicenantes bacterium]
MWKILKLNFRFSLIYLTTALLTVVALKLLTGSPNSDAFVFLSGLFGYVLGFGLIFVSEQYEEKYHGYVFLSTLPLHVHEIVLAKFLRVLIAEILLVGLTIILISLSPGSPDQAVVARSWILLNGLLALALGGLALIGLFSTSYTFFLKISLVFLVFLQIIPMILMSSGKIQAVIDGTIELLSSINWMVWIPVGLVVYFGLMLAAIKVKTLHRC